jgi:hypothetical protein
MIRTLADRVIADPEVESRNKKRVREILRLLDLIVSK